MILRAFVFFSCLFTLQVVSAQTISNAESIIQKFESKLKIVKLPDNIKTEIRSAISTVHTSKAEFRNHKTTFFLCLSGAARLGPAQAAMGLCMDFRNFNLYLLTQLSAGFSADITQTLSILRKLSIAGTLRVSLGLYHGINYDNLAGKYGTDEQSGKRMYGAMTEIAAGHGMHYACYFRINFRDIDDEPEVLAFGGYSLGVGSPFFGGVSGIRLRLLSTNPFKNWIYMPGIGFVPMKLATKLNFLYSIY